MKKRKPIEDRGNRKNTVGGNWTVRFNTTGKANLTITAVNGTTWTNQPYECYDEQTQILTRSEINYEITQDYTEKSCGYGIPERSSLVNSIMMVESEKNDSLLGFIYLKFENETLEDMDSSFTFEVMPQRLIVDRVPEDFIHLLFENLSQDGVLFAGFINGSLTGRQDPHNISHFIVSKNSSTELNLIGVSFLASFNRLTNSSFKGSSSTGCQSILSQNIQSSSLSSPVLMYLSNISFFRISSLATSDQLTQENCFISDLNLFDRDRVMVGIFYISPLFTSSSNFLNCSTFLANLSFRKADQLISGCSSILFFNSSGIDTVSVAISLPPHDSVNTQNTVGIYKYNNLYLNFKLGIPHCSEIHEGYCQDEDGKIYKQEWKYFSELNKNEKVLTLNPETKEKEWQLPAAYQTYDHNGEMYEIVLEDGSTLLVSPEHTVYGTILPDRISRASEGVITLSGKHSFNPLSPERILQSNLRDKAMYGTSFRCGASDMASFALSSNILKGIISTDLLMNSRTSEISPLGSFDNESSLSRLSSSSEYMYCIEINSNLWNTSFNSKTRRDLLLVTNAENTTLKSTTKSIYPPYLFNSSSEYSMPAELRNLFAIDKLTSSASSFACLSVNLDLDTIDSILFILSDFSLNSSFKNLENNSCHVASVTFFPNTISNSLLTSYGTLNSNSPISITNNNIDSEYINTFSLMKISEVHDELVPYKGKIYDVDVPNDIVLVRRHNETIRKPQIAQDYTENKNLWKSVKSRGLESSEIRVNPCLK